MKSNIAKNAKKEVPNQAFFIRLVFNFITGIFMLPIYSMIAAPWLISMLLLTPENGSVQSTMFNVTAWLSGNPSADSLNESDIARAVIAVFLIIELPFIIRSSIKGRSMLVDEVDSRRRLLVIKLAVSCAGWILATAAFYWKEGPGFAFISLILLAGTTAFIVIWHGIFGLMKKIIGLITQDTSSGKSGIL